MIYSKSIESEHLDLIHDVKYDYYGHRMVTCSSDQIIKVWELGENQEWHFTGKLQGHVGSVWKVAWAHPEYGQVIASCGFDRTISIWEEITNNQSGAAGKSDWVRRTQLVDPRTPVTDIQFAPRHLGLQLAACSTDGIIRLYEAQDVMDLSQWTLQHDFTTQITASSLSWSTSPAFPTLLAVGNCNTDMDTTSVNQGSPVTHKVLLYELAEYRRTWDFVESLDKVHGSVHDVAFAPCIGHSFHTLAVAAANLCIFYIRPLDTSQPSTAMGCRYRMELARIMDPVPSHVWRVSWNVVGSVLAASGEDGTVRFLRHNYLRVWRQVSLIQPESAGPSLTLASATTTANIGSIYDTVTTGGLEDVSVAGLPVTGDPSLPGTGGRANAQFQKKSQQPSRSEYMLH